MHKFQTNDRWAICISTSRNQLSLWGFRIEQSDDCYNYCVPAPGWTMEERGDWLVFKDPRGRVRFHQPLEELSLR